jgi:hypothetical protein
VTAESDKAAGDFELRTKFLFAAIDDINGSIKANDAKASVALIVHGLLFTAVLTVTTKIGSTFQDASALPKALMIVFLSVALGAFLVSVVFLMLGARPRRPTHLVKDLKGHYLEAFFPVPRDLRGTARDETGAVQLDEQKKRVMELNRDNVINELSAEVVKLANILDYARQTTQWGYVALAVEIASVSAFLVVVGALAA